MAQLTECCWGLGISERLEPGLTRFSRRTGTQALPILGTKLATASRTNWGLRRQIEEANAKKSSESEEIEFEELISRGV